MTAPYVPVTTFALDQEREQTGYQDWWHRSTRAELSPFRTICIGYIMERWQAFKIQYISAAIGNRYQHTGDIDMIEYRIEVWLNHLMFMKLTELNIDFSSDQDELNEDEKPGR